MPHRSKTIEQAVDEEKRFQRELGAFIAEKVGEAVAPALAELRTAIELIRSVDSTVERLCSHQEKLGKDLVNQAGDINRLASAATRRGLREDMLERKFDKILEIVAPDVLAEFRRLFPVNPPDAGTKP